MAARRPTDEDRVEAARLLLHGLAESTALSDIATAVAQLHPPHNTFPGEVFIDIGCAALDLAAATLNDPIPYDGLREKHLTECSLRGRENRKLQFAILATAAARGGLEPDLLDEIRLWHTDDFWDYALLAAVALIRAGAEKTGTTPEEFATNLARRLNLGRHER